MRRFALVAMLLMVAACDDPAEEAPKGPTTPVQTETPEAVVRRLYASERPPADRAAVEQIFTSDFTDGLAPATGASRLNWDYRYDLRAEQVHPSNVTYATTPRSRVTSRVTVSFTNEGAADSMAYDLCLRGDGKWRIRNIIDPDEGSGSLRYVIGLGPVRGSECP
jgi:hypothetical protein